VAEITVFEDGDVRIVKVGPMGPYNNNAYIVRDTQARASLLVDMPLERWEKILAVNLTGTFLVCKATLPHLLEQGGCIVNVASNTALMGQAYSAAYCASKAGVLMFSKALAAEYLSRGVRVNVIAPGGVDTPLVGTFELPEGADFNELKKIMSPLGFATPAEMAGSVAFLASDESSYTTGAVLSVDGGLTI